MATPTRTLPREGRMPGFDGATGWLNSEPLTSSALRGRVVLVDFWTYTCINWLRTLPYLRAWAEAYRDDGLVVLGVHTPEFSVERDVDSVRRAVQSDGISYPVALDSDHAIWNAFANRYWPALYAVDADGYIRHHRFGEGDYEGSERVLQQLLAEAGGGPAERGLVPVDGDGAEAPADWDHLETGETYLGYLRTAGFVSPHGAAPDQRREYTLPPRLQRNHWALSGDWTVGEEAVALETAGGRIVHRFHARDLHLVMGPAVRGGTVRFRVRLDGRPPERAAGADVDRAGNGVATEHRLYQLIRQPHPITDRTFEIEFLDPGAEARVLTFG
jgi:thiol-disulfide isomerase/thioredoxin